MMPKKVIYNPYLVFVSLACFILAALTGLTYRLGMVGWLPDGLMLSNLRHAHSHLMLFGWAVPLPMYILLNNIVSSFGSQVKGVGWLQSGIIGSLLFGLMAYPFFLFFGYQVVDIGYAELPMSVIFAGLVMISWYVFVWGYLKTRRFVKDTYRIWWDGAITMLVISSLVAWSVGPVQSAMPSNYLMMAGLPNLFITIFIEGWVVLAVLAILITKLQIEPDGWILSPKYLVGFICIGAPLTFAYGIANSLLPTFLIAVARFGGFVAATALAISLVSLVRAGRWKNTIWKWGIGLLALKATMQTFVAILPADTLFFDQAFRILYLHTLLLGALTLTLSGWLQQEFSINKSFFTAVAVAIGFTLLTLIFPTGIWPAMWSGGWVLYILAAGAVVPILAVSMQWIEIYRTTKSAS